RPVDCDDGRFCNGVESCTAGTCRPGSDPCRDGLDCTADSCDEAADACRHVPVDRDGDGFGDAACGGDDCDDGRNWAHPGAPESCAGGVDEDCDGRTDCDDETCAGLPECCVASPEVCNGEDDDCDGVQDDGLSCFYLDGIVIRPFVGPACAAEFYDYDAPRADSANLAPDRTQPDTLIVLAHLGAGPCDGRATLIAVADAADGTGGSARFEWTSDPIEVSPIVVEDDRDDCSHSDRLDAGRCDWDWTATTTDGIALGDYAGDFCLFVRVRTPVGLTAIRVLDAAGPARARDFETVFSLCRTTVPAV
ncbi:MAG: putative metal-binding motif-containing protein, partial [Deltaproteobacteria bacterium]|nr:putative metal-binding motif-containing protein [Deltaproteobacteria bacterium]